MMYPLKMKPIFKERLWGGQRLRTHFGKALPTGGSIGESWELADLPEDKSVIANGPLAGRTLREILDESCDAVGYTREQCAYPFGLLIKLLDANKVLSVQVHPDQWACQKFNGAQLKTECWYVLEAEPDSVIYRGLKRNMSRKKVLEAIEKKKFAEIMEKYPAKKGDFHFLPAGTIHALGEGIMIAEIQTPSDTTFRLYDWERVDERGRSRELHIEESLESIHYTDGTAPPPEPEMIGSRTGEFLLHIGETLGAATLLVDCRFFAVVHVSIPEEKAVDFPCEFPIVMMAIESEGALFSRKNEEEICDFAQGDTVVIPRLDGIHLEFDRPGEILLTMLNVESDE